MDLGMRVSRARCAIVWVGSASWPPCWWPGWCRSCSRRRASPAGTGRAGFDSLLVWGCAAVAAAATGWLWVVATLVTVDAAARGADGPSRRTRRRAAGAARALRRGARPAGSPPRRGRRADADRSGARQVLAGSAAPGAGRRDADACRDRRTTPGRVAGRAAGRRVVAPGDTLWGIGRHLWSLPRASVARARRRSAGRRSTRSTATLIGPDPGLIEPGQRLVLPPPSGRAGGERHRHRGATVTAAARHPPAARSASPACRAPSPWT